MRGFLIAIVLGLTALTFYSALWFKSEAIERDITERVTENLNKAGAKDIGIDVDGRHVTLSGIVYDEQVEAAHLDTADKTHGALGPIDGLTYLPDGGYVSASKTEDGIVLRGTVPDEDTRAALVAAAADATDGEVDDQLMISGPVAAWQDEASFGVGQLAGLTTGSMTAATGAFALSGVTDVNADAVRDAVSDRDGWQAFVSTPNVTDDLSAEVARLNGDVAERNDTIAGLQAEVADLNTSAAGLTEERDALAIELDALRASMTEGQTDTASLREQLAAAVADVDTANGVIAERDATIAELRNQVTDLDGVVANLNTEAEGLNGRIAQLETDLANRQVDLGSTDEQVSALSQTVSDLNADLAGRDTAIANLSAVVAERDESIASLNEAAADSQEKVATLESEVTARAAEIASLTGIVVARNESMASMDQTVADAQAKITALEGEVTTREATIDENQTQIAALQNVVQSYRQVLLC